MFCECSDILVCHGPSVVLDVHRLTIPSGRITAVVGPNGSGKTTLLEVISLLRRPTRGRIFLWSQPAQSRDRELQRKIVMVMSPGYLFCGSVWDNVMFGLKARGVKRKEARDRAAEALRLMDLPNLAHRHVGGLSAGERQRVNLARAIAVRPEALLLDEPTANVDERTVEVVRDLLLLLRKERRTTIVHTTPSTNGLLDISDRAVELIGGKVRQKDQSHGDRSLHNCGVSVPIRPALGHGLAKLRGDASDCDGGSRRRV